MVATKEHARAELLPVRLSDIDRICDFLTTHLRGFDSATRYRVLFEYPWLPDPPARGFFLEDEGAVVGFLGAIYSDRVIGGYLRRFCNLTAWCVLPRYRAQSLDLLFAVTREPDQTIVNLTPNPNVQRILKALQYGVLDSCKLFTIPGAHWWTLLHDECLQVFTDPADVLLRLDDDGRQLMRDHDGSGCRHTLIRGREGDCHVISNRRVKKAYSVFRDSIRAKPQDVKTAP